MMRVEEGVPLEMLDLRACRDDNSTEAQLLNEIVVNVLGPVKTFEEREQIKNMWDPVVRDLYEDYKPRAVTEED